MNENESDWKHLWEELRSINDGPKTPEGYAREITLRERLSGEIRNINTIRGPKTPEEAEHMADEWREAFGNEVDMTFWLENRRQTDAYLNWEFNRRIKELHRDRLEHPRSKTRIEEDPTTRELYAIGVKLYQENRGMTWEQVASRLGVSYGAWKHWRQRFRETS